jgi:DNA-binding GntR family transcriptional regulator
VAVAEANTRDPRAYLRIAALIRQQITEGTLRPTGPAPTITQLVRDHGHARQTCAKALRLLVDEGLMYPVPGLGYYVRPDAVERLGE